MNLTTRMLPALIACVALIAGISACSGARSPTTPPLAGETLSWSAARDSNSDHKLVGLWRLDLEAGLSEPVCERTILEHINIADALLMPEYASAFGIYIRSLAASGPFGPPAVEVTVWFDNPSDMTVWNVRGIVIDDTGLIELMDPDGCTALWDIGDNIPLNPYHSFITEDGSFPPGETIGRKYLLESPTGQLPGSAWFAVDICIDGPIQSAFDFPIAAVNGVFRWPGDSAPIYCSTYDPENVVQWVGAASKVFSGGPTFLTPGQTDEGFREFTGTLDYLGGLGQGVFPLYFAAYSPDDIPTLAATVVRVDPGPFATGPAETGCSQRGYDPARTCRTKAPITIPQGSFIIRPPASISGLVLANDGGLIRRLESKCSIASQNSDSYMPVWTRLIPESELGTVPAVGNDGTIFFLEPEQGRLRAVYPDGSDRWKHQFAHETHTDLVLTSSPSGGLLITILRDNGQDIGLVGVGTDGHLRWQYDFGIGYECDADVPRLAVGPGGTAYYAIPIGGILAFDLNGNPRWAYGDPGWFAARTPVAGDDDQVFFIANNGQLAVCMESSGTTKWTYPILDGRLACFPSLSYGGDLFIAIQAGDDYVAYRHIEGDTGQFIMAIQATGARGYTTHGTSGDIVYVQRDDPTGDSYCCDDFFVCRSPDLSLNWFLNTPGITHIGAYPVVTPDNEIYVQGPHGLYVVII